MSDKPRGPLHDVLVIDMTTNLSGPFSTTQLAELGATVIKIERPPNGDPARRLPPFIGEKSIYFASVNRGKMSICLDMKDETDRNIFESMLAKGDVLVENFRAGVLDRLGYSWDVLHKRWPHLIYGAISGFGHTGPYKPRPAFDMVVQAMGGIMSITGEKGGAPTRAGSSIGDMVPSLYMGMAVSSALYARERNGGLGTKIDIGMLDCQISMLENAIARHFTSGDIPGPIGSRHPLCAPFQAFKTKDSFIVLADSRPQSFPLICEILGDSDMCKDPRYATPLSRLIPENTDSMQERIEELLAKKTSEEWLAELTEKQVACGPVHNVKQAVNDPHILSRNMIVSTEDESIRNIKMAGSPMKFSAYHDPPTRPAAPDTNEHRQHVLDLIGFKQKSKL